MEFTKQAKKAIDQAGRISKRLGHNYIGTEHLLLGILKNQDSLAAHILAEEDVTEEKVMSLIDELITPNHSVSVMERDGRTPKLEMILEQAQTEAQISESDEIGTEHLLLAMIRISDCAASRLLSSLDVNGQELFSRIVAAMGENGQVYQNAIARQASASRSRRGQSSTMDQFSRDLTALASQGKLDPVIGREEEIRRVIEILSRRTKNNPCLIGEPGVGKTAIAEGLAQRIESGSVPESVSGKRLLSLDLSGMVAGTKYRGEFEERIKNLINEVIADGNVILFIDEIHTIIGAGGAEGAMDAANILKPALSRGEIQVVGATTIEEYRKYIEKDSALERRFQPVTVEEPTTEQTRGILFGIRSLYEDHHDVEITDEAVESCVALSERYISDRFLPDKAIDLMDESAARVRLSQVHEPDRAYETENEIHRLEGELEQALSEGRYDEASLLKNKRQDEIRRFEREKKRRERSRTKNRPQVTASDVAEVVSTWTKIPVARLNESEASRLRNLEKTLHKRVVGQEEAICAVARAVRRGRVGLKEPNRPIGSFLFLGPTGVGKTEVSKALAEAVFGNEDNMIRVDMSEYMEKYSVSKMIGSPPGYVGYEEGGQLSEKVRRNPYSVILFDEIEKAHPDVFNVLLQVLDDGRITDGQGRRVDFKNTIIIMTSNAGAQQIMEPKHLGFSADHSEKADYEYMKSRVMEELKHTFKPEFLNRIDETIVFRALTKDDMKKIVGIMTSSLIERCRSRLEITLKVTPSAKNYIVEKAYDPKYGARPLRRKIQTEIEDPLSEKILSGEISRGDTVSVGAGKDGLRFKTS